MRRWDDTIHEEHESLRAQAEDLRAVLAMSEAAPAQRQAALAWILQGLWPALEVHLQREEEIFLPALRRLPGDESRNIALLQEEHGVLQAVCQRLAERLADPAPLRWSSIQLVGGLLRQLIEDHEQHIERLVIDVLEFNLAPGRLAALARAFEAPRPVMMAAA